MTWQGILNLDKPPGITSHGVVARVKRLTRVKRVGHAGTLDPMATGVLLLCLGRATRIAEYLMAEPKRYRATIRLGISTDSHDADGQIVSQTPVTATRADVETALATFRGLHQQVPPMVSALKRDGQPLYKLARQGIVVEREPRPVEISELDLLDWAPPDVTIELSCSPGTYVRALARDLGVRLGCGAHLTKLTRLACGHFELQDAVSLERFTQAMEAGRGQELVQPIDAGLRRFPACRLDGVQARRVRSGQTLALSQGLSKVAPNQLCRAYNEAGLFLALLAYDAEANRWRPHKVFHPLN